MEFVLITLLNSLSYGLLLFMLSSGLTLIFGMMGVLNFAHASFYMLGAYFAYSISIWVGFWPALILAPVLVGIAGALIERFGIRSIHRFGHIAQLLFTFGLTYIVVELIQVIWGRSAVPYKIPVALDGPLFTVFTTTFPIYRSFMMLIATGMLAAIYLIITRTRIGLIIQAALTHPDTVESLGHNVPRVMTLVFGGGCALAGLAGVIGGNAMVTEPSMAATIGSIIFVVVIVGGLGSVPGAFLASLIIGTVQTYAVTLDYSIADLLDWLGVRVGAGSSGHVVTSLTISQTAPILPYVLLILVLIFRPKGLLGNRES